MNDELLERMKAYAELRANVVVISDFARAILALQEELELLREELEQHEREHDK